MTGEAARLREPRVLDDLRAVTGPAGVSATVAVQAATTEAETTWLLALAAESDGLVAGVVGWVDLEAPDVAERLARLRAAPGGERLAGIRHPVHDEPDPAWLDRGHVRRGLRAVAAAGLTYDLLLFPEHLAPALRVAEALPELALVVDHGAKPPIAAGGWEPWSPTSPRSRRTSTCTASCPGLVTEAAGTHWREHDVERYAARLLELFGPRAADVRLRLAGLHARRLLRRGAGRRARRPDRLDRRRAGRGAGGGTAREVLLAQIRDIGSLMSTTDVSIWRSGIVQ